MRTLFKRLSVGVAVGAVIFLLLGGLGHLLGLRINTTRSIPVGLYQIQDVPLQKGSYVLFCPPENKLFAMARRRGYIGSGFCPGEYGYMMKKVVATEGDTVTVTAAGVTVEKQLLPYSRLLAVDSAGRFLPRYPKKEYRLGPAELLLMSDVSAISFDGRYFGPVYRSQVVSVIRPVLTW